MHPDPDALALRRAVLAVSVLDDIDLDPADDGIVLGAGAPVEVSWLELGRVLSGSEPGSDRAHRRLRRHLQVRRWAADTPREEFGARARPVGYAVGDPMHPGVDWVRERVLGGVLDLGFGLLGIGPDPDAVVAVPPVCFSSARVDPSPWWPVTRHYIERMGSIAVQRLDADRTRTLRPIGDCDVVTLLAARSLRAHLCAGSARGLCAAAVPMRRRGWLDLTRIDPAFALAAAAATDDEERGFSGPLLLTVDEVTLAAQRGRPAEIVLRDPVVGSPHLRAVRWR